ncbi:glycerol kinase GlpK [Svornostia abyssi]|uniref:ATP:glycerol 3-phosphotransferase n=1 Tax=Svornostia abyssi TaxID=2898438 RepID=A0ABY5PFW9_9ACTN|nr:glycerol kinase GlpK [Parviterribacteraceae bacterium J379]
MILAIDQGTTGSTCLVFDEDGELAGRAYREFRQHFPQPGWVEHDARELWEVTRDVALEALDDAGVPEGGLRAVGITNQRETVCVWDPDTGQPLHRALVWQDRRTAARCDELREAGHEPLIRERTGLVIDPYFSGTKIAWLLEHVDGLRERAAAGRAKFGTVDSWLIHNLCGEHVTDASNASRTLLANLHTGDWDDELLSLFGDIPRAALPEIRPSIGELGRIAEDALPGFGGVPVSGVAGDQQAALYGQACLDPGLGKNTYGTGSFVLMNTGDAPPAPAEGLLSTVAWRIGQRTQYALEASIFVTGAAVQWLRDGLGLIEVAAETEPLAASLQSNDGVYFVPALTGLGSPHWDPYARGTIVGLTRGASRAHLARATLEAIAYQAVDAVRAMETSGAPRLAELRVDGGATVNAWLMQFQADVLGVPVVVPHIHETTALGAARLAGVGCGLWTQTDVQRGWREEARYEPRMSADEREALLHGWHRAVDRARG